MKKLLLIVGSLILLLLAAMIIVPYFFKDDIVSLIKTETNKNLNAEVAFDNDIGLSFFSNFPNFTLTVKNFQVTNKGPFEGDTLAQIQRFRATVDVMSLISGDQIEVRTIDLQKPRFHVHVLKDGQANYDIMKASESEEASAESDTGGAGTFKLALQKYAIKDGYVVYDDKSIGFYTKVDGLTHEGSGDFTTNIFNLDTRTLVDKLTLGYGGINYIDQVETELDAKLKMNMEKFKFTFMENSLRLNEFFLAFDGFFAMPGDAMEMDISFNADKTKFKNLISLVPAIYTEGYEDLKTAGNMTFNGLVQGTYTDDQYPAFDFNLKVNDGMFKYPDLPTGLNNVNLDLLVNNEDRELDKTVVNLSKLHFELGEEPFNAHLLLKTPISDPYVETGINGNINLANIQELVPMPEGTQINGMLSSGLNMKGHYSTIENENYEEFEAGGTLSLKDFLYNSDQVPQPVAIEQMQMDFSPSHVNLSKFALNMGDNNLYANGRLENMLGYALKSKTINGDLTLTSNYMNINDFMPESSEEETEETPEEQTAEETEPMQVVEVPANIDFIMDAGFDRLIYDNLDMRNTKGKVVIRDQALMLKDFGMEMLEGELMANGKYDTKEKDKPQTEFDLQIKGMDIQKAYETFKTMQEYAPVAARAEGSFDANLNFTSPLDQNMLPVYDKLFSKGKLSIDRVKISDHKVLNKIADVTKNEKYRRLVLTDIRPSYVIEEGRIRLTEPIEFNVDEAQFAFDGSMGLDQSLDYVMETDVPGGKIQQQAGQFINQLAGDKAKIDVGDRIRVDFEITGTSDNPKIKPVFKGTSSGDGGDQDLKRQAKEKLEEEKQKIKDKARKEKERAQQRAEEEKEKAKQKAKEKKKEAERKAQEKKEKAKEKLEKEKEKKKEDAKDKVKDIFK